jgi:hypothetical protein
MLHRCGNESYLLVQDVAARLSCHELRVVEWLAPLECDSDEGTYPELEFRFDATNHPLHGLATLVTRAERATLNIYNGDFSGLTMTGLFFFIVWPHQ